MASVLTHKKVPEWGGFNWDSPRQRHRFCYKVDGGASFFQIWVTKTYQIIRFQTHQADRNKKPTKYLNKFKITNTTKFPQISHTQIAYMRSDGFFLQMLQREQWSNRSLPHNLRYQDPKFLVFIPISEGNVFFSRSVLHSLCPHDPWDSLWFSLQIHFLFFVSAYLFQMGSEGNFFSSDPSNHLSQHIPSTLRVQ